MKVAWGLVGLVLCVACTAPAPQPVPAQRDDDGVSITIVNEGDEPASVEVIRMIEATGRRRPAMEPFELGPRESATVRMESTRDLNFAYHLLINGSAAVSSDFLGCRGAGNTEGPLPRSQTITVLPNGQPQTCR